MTVCRQEMTQFAEEREWNQFHTPRNLALALTGEVGELAEIFQWRGEVPQLLPGWKPSDVVHLGEELSDVLLYTVRLASVCGIDLPAAATRKMGMNRRKYPVDQAKGRSDKYTAYSATSVTTAESVATASASAPASASSDTHTRTHTRMSTAASSGGVASTTPTTTSTDTTLLVTASLAVGVAVGVVVGTLLARSLR